MGQAGETRPDRSSQGPPEAAASITMTESHYQVEVHRLRRRFADALRQEVAETVSNPAEVEEETRHLLNVLAWCGQSPA
jgi:RNA polymerase sigma-70 factor (ECF subfamily)